MIRTILPLAAFLTTPALAAEPASEDYALPRLVAVEARIELSDLDLRSPAAVAELHRRVSRVVDDMCRPVSVPAGLGRGRLDGNCARRARASARAQIERAIAARAGSLETAMTIRGAR
ncbi:UrcA family protein [Sphingosinicella sp. YJ22]|uniref:UrcA family protein n=1 Tax=Sphingosinicella sp. YJ22 TaxID=1104780 RepID=UPI001408F9C6|nr:UrcA family protein [Sphingosinicella sp. YJ22]